MPFTPPAVEGSGPPTYCRRVIRQTLSTTDAAPATLVSLARAGLAGLRLAELRTPAALVPPGQLILPAAQSHPHLQATVRSATSATA